jgi:SAM-dependent methyltransferase
MPSDPTFTTYSSTQARTYAQHRLSYPSKLYDTILNHHTNTGGQLKVLADIGCGPGRATRDLAAFFEVGVGLDPGEEMIKTARALSEEESRGYGGREGKARFAVCGAEDCARGVRDVLCTFKKEGSDDGQGGEGRVDLLTAAMAVLSPSPFHGNALAMVNQSLKIDTGTLVLHALLLGPSRSNRKTKWHRGPLDMLFLILS